MSASREKKERRAAPAAQQTAGKKAGMSKGLKTTLIVAAIAVFVALVDALVKGTEIPVNDTTTYDNGVKVVPAYLCEVDNIDASNYMKLFESGFYDKADDTWAGIVE